MSKERDACCRAIAKGGRPCRAAATASGLCFFHGNPNKAVELGSIGGKRNRRPSTWDPDPLPPLDNTRSAVDDLNRIYDGVISGTITPKIATTLVQLINAKERMTEKMVIERQIAQMQDDLRTLKSLIQIRTIDVQTSDDSADEEPES
jgi:hypothetical protein